MPDYWTPMRVATATITFYFEAAFTLRRFSG